MKIDRGRLRPYPPYVPGVASRCVRRIMFLLTIWITLIPWRKQPTTSAAPRGRVPLAGAPLWEDFLPLGEGMRIYESQLTGNKAYHDTIGSKMTG